MDREELLKLGLYERSKRIAEYYFSERSDKAGVSYLYHLNAVAKDFTNEYQKSLAILHDLLEDTDIKEETLLEYGYSIEFINDLKLLTNTYENYDLYIDNLVNSNNRLVLEIKLRDLLNNMDITRLDKITSKDIKRITDKYIPSYMKIVDKIYEPLINKNKVYEDDLIKLQSKYGEYSYDYRGVIDLEIVDKSNGAYIGRLEIRRDNACEYEVLGNVGIELFSNYRHMGYGSRVLKLALDLLKDIGYEKIRITCEKENVASTKLFINFNGEYRGLIDIPSYSKYYGSGKQILAYEINIRKRIKK